MKHNLRVWFSVLGEAPQTSRCIIGLLLLTLLSGCASTPEQRQEEANRQEERRQTEEQRKIAEEHRKVEEENKHWQQVLAPLTDQQLRFRLAALEEAVTRGTLGTGLLLAQRNGIGFIIAKGELEAKVKERDAVGMELARREGVGRTTTPHPRPQTAESAAPIWTGSGFFVTEDGYLITNAHVIEGAQSVKVKHGGRLWDAVVVRKDSGADLAVLKVSGDFRPLPLADSRRVKLGQRVYTLGFPKIHIQGEEPKFTEGSISGLFGLQDNSSEFQVSVPVQPGNSGGPLVNPAGHVVGVVCSKLRGGENVNYAVKSSRIRVLLDELPEAKLRAEEVEQSLSPEQVAERLQTSTALLLIY